METRKVQYERLFNLSNYEHEKFVVSLELSEDENPDQAFKAMAIQVLELEGEIARFRTAFISRQELRSELRSQLAYRSNSDSEDDKKRIKKRLRYLDLVVEDFKLKHQPRHKECKCFYCQHPDYDETEYPD